LKTIEVLTTPDCPHAQETLDLVNAIVAEQRLRAVVHHAVVPDDETARRLRFPGSPTVRVDGYDVAPIGAGLVIGLACRVYVHGDEVLGVPPSSLIRRAIQDRRQP
jgi:glutaredoxin